MGSKLKCPRCGGEKYKKNNEGVLSDTFLICQECGNTGTPQAWEKTQSRMKAANFDSSVANNPSKASDKPEIKNDPTTTNVNQTDKKYRKKPERRIQPEDSENVRNPGMNSTAKINPFLKQSIVMEGDEDQAIANAINHHIEMNLARVAQMYSNQSDELGYDIEDVARLKRYSNSYMDNLVNAVKEKIYESGTKFTYDYAKLGYIINPILEEIVKTFHQNKDPNINPLTRGAQRIQDNPNFNLSNILDEIKQWGISHEKALQIANDVFNKIPLSEKGNSEFFWKLLYKELRSMNKEVVMSTNPFIKKSKNKNPFLKEAREFRRSDWGDFKKQDSENNMIWPEGKQGVGDSEKKEKTSTTSVGDKDPGHPSDPYDSDTKYYDYDTVDRKEYRSSPKPEQMIPGYKEWKDNQVDSYYDGWVEDHIENSGGKIVGSNTEKTMNLNDGERAHTPQYPTEAIYEKLLESRHEFNDDYTVMVANNKEYVITKTAAEKIIGDFENDNLFISESALARITKKADCPECKKKILAKKKWQFHGIPS